MAATEFGVVGVKATRGGRVDLQRHGQSNLPETGTMEIADAGTAGGLR